MEEIGTRHIKRCRICEQEKDLDCFYVTSARTKDGHRHECKTCWNKKARGYYLENKERVSEINKIGHFRRKYGLSLDDLERLKKWANHRCEICNKERPLVVDHSHRTGKVRGMLCNPCNQALGSIEESPATAATMLTYITKRC